MAQSSLRAGEERWRIIPAADMERAQEAIREYVIGKMNITLAKGSLRCGTNGTGTLFDFLVYRPFRY
jgi:hypothetical protein